MNLRTGIAVMVSLLAIAMPLRGDARKSPLFDKVSLLPIVVEPQRFENTPARLDETEIAHKLSEEATRQARRILVCAHIARTVERSTILSSDTASNTATAIPTTTGEIVVVTGTLRLPISLPSRVRGWNASQRKGRFAIVGLTLRDARTGAILLSGEGTCDWKDAWWTTGGGHGRRNAPLDHVLEHFARKTTERAVWDAARRGKHEKTETGKETLKATNAA